jgi:hypothetical protein
MRIVAHGPVISFRFLLVPEEAQSLIDDIAIGVPPIGDTWTTHP